MTLRFRIAQVVLVMALVAGLAATMYARDDDPRDFSRKNNSRTETRVRDSRINENQNRSRNERDDDNRSYRDRDEDRDDDRRRRDDRDDDDDDDDEEDRGSHQNHNNKKVTICHKEGNHPGGKSITVSWNAVAAHQAHGDTLGHCPVSKCK